MTDEDQRAFITLGSGLLLTIALALGAGAESNTPAATPEGTDATTSAIDAGSAAEARIYEQALATNIAIKDAVGRMPELIPMYEYKPSDQTTVTAFSQKCRSLGETYGRAMANAELPINISATHTAGGRFAVGMAIGHVFNDLKPFEQQTLALIAENDLVPDSATAVCILKLHRPDNYDIPVSGNYNTTTPVVAVISSDDIISTERMADQLAASITDELNDRDLAALKVSLNRGGPRP